MLVKSLERPGDQAAGWSHPMKKQMMEKLKSTILSNLSYSHICLGDFSTAFKYGLELLESKEALTPFMFLANMYCAESLLMMDRAQQVFPYMNPSLLKELRPMDFESHSSGWQGSSLELVTAIFHYNSSVVSLMMNSLSKAGVMLAKSNHPDIIDKTMKLKVYLDLCCGSPDLPRNLALIEDKCLK